MTYEEARAAILNAHKDSIIMLALELPDKYVFAIKPKNWDNSKTLLDPFFSVNKSGSSIKEFAPQMDLEAFKDAMKNHVLYKEGDEVKHSSLELQAAEAYIVRRARREEELEHYQVKGAKHGVRRYQNYDGSYTPLGREHYGIGPPRKKKEDIEPEPAYKNAMQAGTVQKATSTAARKAYEAAKGWNDRRKARKALAAEDPSKRTMAQKLGDAYKARRLEAMTKNKETLVKNRKKLTEEQFEEAKARLLKEEQQREDDQKFLKGNNEMSAKPSDEKSHIEETEKYAKMSADELIKLAKKGKISPEEFDRVKNVVASRSMVNLHRLEPHLSPKEYQDAMKRYQNTVAAREDQVNRDVQTFANRVQSGYNILNNVYNSASIVSQVTTGRKLDELAKVTLGKQIMSQIDRAQLQKYQNDVKVSEAVSKYVDVLVANTADTVQRAKQLGDQEYVDTMARYYEDILSYMNGMPGKNNQGNKGNKGNKNGGGGGKP